MGDNVLLTGYGISDAEGKVLKVAEHFVDYSYGNKVNRIDSKYLVEYESKGWGKPTIKTAWFDECQVYKII